jgi:hypothetical protein
VQIRRVARLTAGCPWPGLGLVIDQTPIQSVAVIPDRVRDRLFRTRWSRSLSA